MKRPLIISWLLLATGLFLFADPATSQVPDSIVRRLMSDYSVPGLSLAVIQGDSVGLYGWGFASEDGETPVTPDTPFRIASVAKPLVAATVLIAAHTRSIPLESDIEALTGFPLDQTIPGPVTLHNLLTHTGGFDERMVGYAARSSEDMRPLGEYLAERMPDRGWHPGDIVSYSNHGMSLAAYIVERASGQSFAQVASSSLFTPLRMTSTRFLEGGVAIPTDAAQPLRCGDEGCSVRPHFFSHTYPAGLAFSTARDMGEFIKAVLESQAQGGPLSELIPTRFTHDSRIPGMSYGFFNQTFQGHRVIAHSGSTGGYWALLLLIPDQEVGFFLAANGGSSSFGAIMRDRLLPLLVGASEEARLDPDPTENPAVRAGSYELTRYSHSTVERLPQLFYNSINLAARGDTLLVYSGGGPDAYLQVGDSLYQGIEAGDLLAFGNRRGAPYLFRSSDVYGAQLPAAYERRSATQNSYFMNEYLSWVMALPILLLGIAWPLLLGLDAYLRRRRGVQRSPTRLPHFLTTLAMSFTVGLFAWFGFGFVAKSNRLLESGEMLFGMPQELSAILWMPYVHAALAGLFALSLPMVWKGKWWGLTRRLLFSVLVAGLLLQTAFLIQWNYLPATW